MIDDLKEGSYVKMKRKAEDRVAWRSCMLGPADGSELMMMIKTNIPSVKLEEFYLICKW